nr:MMPL family transporter [Actinomycetes bacterium]
MLHRIASLAIAAPRRVLFVAALVMIGVGVFGMPVADHLSSGGFQDPHSESTRASTLLTDKFGQSDQQLLVTVSAPEGVTSASARSVATGIVDGLTASPHVLS